MSYIDALRAAREKFHVVGVVGMTHSGVNTFFTQLWQRNMLVIRGTDGGIREAMATMIERGDQWTTLHVQHRGIKWSADEQSKVTVDPDTFIPAMLKDFDFYTKFLEQSFETRMEQQVYRIRTLCDFYPGLSRSMSIPLFVELPLSAAVENYNDLVDEMLVVKRKRDISTEHWAYQHFSNITPFTEEQTTQDRLDFLSKMDKYWDRCKIKPNSHMINHGSLEEYINTVNKYLDTKVSGTASSLSVESILGVPGQ